NRNFIHLLKYKTMFETAIQKIFRKPTDRPTDEIVVLYGSHSGNSEFIAKEAQKYLKKNGLSVTACDMAKYEFGKLTNEKSVLIVVSTQGEGDPPDSAQKFCKNLFAENAPLLTNLQFAVCALGDSSYEHFCKTGKDIDRRLGELGAIRFHQRVDCDVEFHQAASGWVSEVLGKYSGKTESAPVQINTENLHRPYPAIVKEKFRLNEGSPSETYHIVLAVDDPDFRYQPGDTVGIFPENQDELADQILKQLNVSPEKVISFENKTIPLRKLLTAQFELTAISKKLLENYQKLTQKPELEKLLTDGKKLQDYIRHHDVLDVLVEFPFSGNPEDLIAVLRKLQPRYYSIASSQRKHPGEVHLIVKLVQSEQNGRIRSGACSSYLNRWIEVGQKINVQLIPNEQFRMQTGETPMIMVAAGTGIAPFRAFLEEWENGNLQGETWLIFGEKHRDFDFFYQKEWEYWLENNQLDRLDVAFSRDQAEKVYVQHKIEEQADEFYQWLNRGAHVYVCGSVAMGNEVRQAICRVIQTAGGKTEKEATAHWENLLNENRIHQDLY
ncbi:MAG: flavodoxin domain-containing protein, partial [Prolixibacteraceae bacterium]|nr:flavodoxin domain-containing protein [Prolixibacteraceae bacterium]